MWRRQEAGKRRGIGEGRGEEVEREGFDSPKNFGVAALCHHHHHHHGDPHNHCSNFTRVFSTEWDRGQN